jgi:hypothetical protein
VIVLTAMDDSLMHLRPGRRGACRSDVTQD